MLLFFFFLILGVFKVLSSWTSFVISIICFVQQVNRLEITPDKRFLAAAGNPHIRLFDVNSNSPQPVCLFNWYTYFKGNNFFYGSKQFVFLILWQVMSYDSHTNNVMAVGFQCDGNWMYSGSEDGTVKIWDLRWSRLTMYNEISL